MMSQLNSSGTVDELLSGTVYAEQQIADSITDLETLKETIQAIADKLSEVVEVNCCLVKRVDELTKNQDEIYDQLYDHKVDLTSLNQYGRRENVEFCGIPETIKQEDLLPHIVEVMKSMGLKRITEKDIHNYHRIGKQSNSRPRNVIIRFVNRKTAFTLLKNKKKLNSGKFKRYFITENLCPYNKQIFNKLYRLKKNKEIHSLWTFNGNVFVKVAENDERTQVFHLDDIDGLFADREQVSDDSQDSRVDHVASVSSSESDESEASSNTSARRKKTKRIHPAKNSNAVRRLSPVSEANPSQLTSVAASVTTAVINM